MRVETALKRWYALQIPSEGRRALRFPVAIADVDLWFPKRTVRVLVDGGWIETDELITPGYVLASSPRGWAHIEKSIGIGLVRGSRGKPPVSISGEEVDLLRATEDVELWTVGTNFALVPGQPARVRHDAGTSYAGMLAKFVGMFSVRGGFYATVVVAVAEGWSEMVTVPLDHLEEVVA